MAQTVPQTPPQIPASRLCDPEGAIPADVRRIAPDGTIALAEGPALRLANIVWPDRLEPNLREKLANGLAETLRGQRISWKPVAPPDRWGTTPAFLFVREPDSEAGPALPPFWLQAGMVEAGLVPAWPDIPGCWDDLVAHEAIAIARRRGHWAPRVQASRLSGIEADAARHAGRRMVVIWTLAHVRPWRDIYYLNIQGMRRGGASLSATANTISALTRRGMPPELLANRRVIVRFTVPREGLRRTRLESADHLTPLEKTGFASQR